MFVFSEESTASKMVEAIVGCSYLGIERCAEEYADFSYKNGKGQHGWALIFQQISGTLPEMGYRVIQRTAGSWPYAVMFDSYSGTAITLLREENYRSRQDEIQRGIDLSGVKKIRLHDLRHSHASLLISKLGAQPNLVADRLGHEKVQTTLSTYSHLYPDQSREFANQLEKLVETDEN